MQTHERKWRNASLLPEINKLLIQWQTRDQAACTLSCMQTTQMDRAVHGLCWKGKTAKQKAQYASQNPTPHNVF